MILDLQYRLRALLLVAPAIFAAVYLGWRLGPLGLLNVAAIVLVAPYALGWYEGFYKPWAMRKTQRLMLDLVPMALTAADKLVPTLLAEGMSGERLVQAVKEELETMTGTSLDAAMKDTLIERAMEQAWRLFDPRVLLDHAVKPQDQV